MQVNELYALAASNLSETPEQNGLEEFVVGWVNILLAESLPYENALRRCLGLEELPVAPVVQSLTEEIPFLPQLQNPALVYGLTHYVMQDDDNEYRTQKYRSQYISALSDAVPYRQGRTVDVYGICGGDE